MKKINFLAIHSVYLIFWFCILLITNIETMSILGKIEMTISIFIMSMISRNIFSMILSQYFLFGGKNNIRDIIRFKNFMICFKIFCFFFFTIMLLFGLIGILTMLTSNEGIEFVITIWMSLPIAFSIHQGINEAMDRLENGFRELNKTI